MATPRPVEVYVAGIGRAGLRYSVLDAPEPFHYLPDSICRFRRLQGRRPTELAFWLVQSAECPFARAEHLGSSSVHDGTKMVARAVDIQDDELRVNR